MRAVVVSNIVSLDGFYADAAGNAPFAGMDHAFDEYNLERLEQATTVLLGRQTFEGFSSYWPRIAEAPIDLDDRAVDDTNRSISRRYSLVEKAVVSDDLALEPGHPWAATTRIVSGRDVAAWLHQARLEGVGEIVIFGSRLLWNSLVLQGLVDEVHLMVAPVVLGAGTPAFTAGPGLNLLAVRQFPGSDNVVLRYGIEKVND